MNRDQHIQESDSDGDSDSDGNSYSDGDSDGNSNSDSNSEGDSNSDNVTSITDSDHQGASSSQLVTPLVECNTVGMKRRRESKCDRTVETNIEKPQDCDEYYFMNLVKMFKKLSPRKKSEVRMKIERLLFEAEFE